MALTVQTPDPCCILPTFVHPLFPVFKPHIQKWVIFSFFCSSSPLDLPKCQTIIIVRSVAGRRPASPSHKHGSCPPLKFQRAFQLNIARRGRCSAGKPAEGPKVRSGSRSGVSGFGFRSSVVGFNVWFGRTQTTRNVTWGSMCPCASLQQCLKTARHLKIEKKCSNK